MKNYLLINLNGMKHLKLHKIHQPLKKKQKKNEYSLYFGSSHEVS